MNIKKYIVLLTGIALLVAFMSACSGTESSSTTTGATGTSSSKSQTPAAPAKPVGKVDILSQTGAINDISMYEINGEVQNNTGAKVTFVSISATFYNSAGAVIDTATTYSDPTDLEPGAKAPFKVLSAKSDISGQIARFNLVTSHN